MARPMEDQVLVVDDFSSDLPSSMEMGGPISTTIEEEWCSRLFMRKTIPMKLKIEDRGLEYSGPTDPPKETNLDLYFIEGKLTSDPDWEKWRNSLRMTVGGHTIGGLLGFSAAGESAHKNFSYLMNWEEKPPTNWFGKQAQNHGKQKEPLAKAFILEDMEKINCQEMFESESILYEIRSDARVPGVALGVCVTPDMHFEDGRIVEIKCPYYNSDKFEFPSDYETDVQARRTKKYGALPCVEPSWFLQVAFYAWIIGARHFSVDVMYYTTQTDLFRVVSHVFYMCPQVKQLFATQILHLLGEIANSHEYQNKPSKKYKPAGGLLDCRLKVLEAMDRSFNYIYAHKTYQYHIDGTWSRCQQEQPNEEITGVCDLSASNEDSNGFLVFKQSNFIFVDQINDN